MIDDDISAEKHHSLDENLTVSDTPQDINQTETSKLGQNNEADQSELTNSSHMTNDDKSELDSVSQLIEVPQSESPDSGLLVDVEQTDNELFIKESSEEIETKTSIEDMLFEEAPTVREELRDIIVYTGVDVKLVCQFNNVSVDTKVYW